MLQKEHGIAIANLTVAIELNNDYSKAYGALASIYYQQAKYEQAIKTYDMAIEKDPTDINAYEGRAAAHSAMGDEAAAHSDLEKANVLKQVARL